MENHNKNILLVNTQDEAIGVEKTLKTHSRRYLKLHRAFSVFLFNSNDELLLQRRSPRKLTFPNRWANSVCSHPFANDLSFTDPLMDVKIQSIRRIDYELGMKSIRVEDLQFIARVVYKATDNETYGWILPGYPRAQVPVKYAEPVDLAEPYSEGFYEWEVDYIIFATSDDHPNPNCNEISEVRYTNRSKFEELIKGADMSPWLKEISRLIDIFGVER